MHGASCSGAAPPQKTTIKRASNYLAPMRTSHSKAWKISTRRVACGPAVQDFPFRDFQASVRFISSLPFRLLTIDWKKRAVP